MWIALNDDEKFESIVSSYCPQQTTKPGDELKYSYRLHWAPKRRTRSSQF